MNLCCSLWLQSRHFHKNVVRNGSNRNIHNSPATYDTECFQDQCFNSDTTIMIIRRRMLHDPTTLYVTDLKNNHSLMRLANYGDSLNWLCFGTDLILLFFGVFSGDQCQHWIRRQILHETVFLSQILTMVFLHMNPSILKAEVESGETTVHSILCARTFWNHFVEVQKLCIKINYLFQIIFRNTSRKRPKYFSKSLKFLK